MSSIPKHNSQVVDVVLTEFTALRAELVQLTAARYTVVGLNVTGVAAVGGLVIVKQTDPRLLLLVPFIAATMGLLFNSLVADTRTIATYVERVQRPLLVEQLGEPRLFEYEEYFGNRMYGRRLAQALMHALLFPGVSLAALVFVASELRSVADWSIWILGGVLLMTQSAVWFIQPWNVPEHRGTGQPLAAMVSPRLFRYRQKLAWRHQRKL